MTGLALGDGGIPKDSFGVREPLLLRDPGIGGRSNGAGDEDDIMDSREYSIWSVRRWGRDLSWSSLDRAPIEAEEVLFAPRGWGGQRRRDTPA